MLLKSISKPKTVARNINPSRQANLHVPRIVTTQSVSEDPVRKIDIAVVMHTSFEKILLFLLQAQLNVKSTEGAPIGHASNPTSSLSLNIARSVEQCGFDGNPDFYGLGIRIAIYLQWATALIANHVLHEDSVKGYLETNSVFLVAVFVALAIATAGKDVRSAEIVVLLQLCFGFIFSVLSIWGYRTRTKLKDPIRFPLMGSSFRLALSTAICGYSIWFWFTGIHSVDDRSCPSYTFIFAKANIRGGIRVLFEVQSVLILVVYALLLLQEFLVVIAFTISSRSPPMGFPPLLPLPISSKGITSLDEAAKSTVGQWCINSFNVVALIWAVASIEFTLLWNSVEGVSGLQSLQSTGQLIPLIISILGLLRLLHAISVRRSKVNFTNILVGLLDNGAPIRNSTDLTENLPRTSVSKQSDSTIAKNMPFEKNSVLYYPLKGGYEALFDIQKPKRRHSFEANSLDTETTVIDHKSPASKYTPEEIDIFTLKNGHKIFFVKDFEKSGRPEGHDYHIFVPKNPREKLTANVSARFSFAFVEFVSRLSDHITSDDTNTEQTGVGKPEGTAARALPLTESTTVVCIPHQGNGQTQEGPTVTPETQAFECTHRRKRVMLYHKDEEKIKFAWHERSLYHMLAYASEPLAQEAEKSSMPKTAALLREIPGVITMAKEIGSKHKRGEINRYQQHEDLCQLFGRYRKDLDELAQGEEFEAWNQRQNQPESKAEEATPKSIDLDESGIKLSRAFTWPVDGNRAGRGGLNRKAGNAADTKVSLIMRGIIAQVIQSVLLPTEAGSQTE
ncbi:hypothetical protein F5882DRAFT_444824 [Hyaloscypha sp. PMI_1271]|nr:hypothetical protein F5882DRAFT_444824 [Hyaloscypha sp. PMI_1271]